MEHGFSYVYHMVGKPMKNIWKPWNGWILLNVANWLNICWIFLQAEKHGFGERVQRQIGSAS